MRSFGVGEDKRKIEKEKNEHHRLATGCDSVESNSSKYF